MGRRPAMTISLKPLPFSPDALEPHISATTVRLHHKHHDAAHPSLANVPRVVTAYYAYTPDPSVEAQRVAFGTSGHHGSALDRRFNEAHLLSLSQAMCDY